MDCSIFQDQLSDYLDGALEARGRAECAGHRLVCRACRELYDDVRVTVQTLNVIARECEPVQPEGLAARILAATTAGEMLSCASFDHLLERYFDGVMLAPDFQVFQAHFEQCTKCRRLLAGIEEAVALCREVKADEVEAPAALHDRIIAATIGKVHAGGLNPLPRIAASLAALGGSMLTPRWAVALLIFAASAMLIHLRFGSVEGMAQQANARAERLVSGINQTGVRAGHAARTGFNNVTYQFAGIWAEPPARPSAARPAPQTQPSPVCTASPPANQRQ